MIKSLTNEYKPLSNYFEAKFEFKGIKYRNVINAFVAQFFENETQQRVIAGSIPSRAQTLLKSAPLKMTEEEQLALMHDIIMEKVKAHKEIKELLLNSEGEIINNVSWDDTFWGVMNGEGKNHTGKILESIREELKEKKSNSKKKKEKKEKLDAVIEEMKVDGVDGEESNE